MAEDFVQLPVNGAGSKLRTEKLTIGVNEVHQEVTTPAFANGDLVPGTLADGTLVNLGANNDVTVAGVATLAEQLVQSASLSVLDDWDEADRAKTNPIVGQAGVQGGSGVITAITQRVVVATDQPPIPVTGGGGGTEYAEDTPSGAGDLGTFTLAKRQDVPAADVDTDGDRARLTVDSVNRLWVNGSSVTQPISAAALPLPAGAATAALQLPDGHNVTANAGTNLNTSLLALESGGNLQSAAASLDTIDNWGEADRVKVNPIVGQVGVAGGSGLVGASTQRVTLATDVGLPAGTNNIGDVDIASLPNEGQQTMANSISVAIASDQSAIPVTGTVSVTEPVTVDNAGTFAVQVSSIAAGDNNIGNVDIVTMPAVAISSFPDNEPFNVAQWGGSAVTGGAGAVAAGTPRITHASDDPVTTALQIIDDWDETDRAKVNLIVGQAGVAAGSGAAGTTTQRVIAATDSPEVTALQIMDDWDNGASDGASVSGDVAHDSADAGEPVKIGGVAVSGSASPTSVASGDRTRFIANQHGIPYHIGGHPNLITREYDFGASAQTDVNLAAAAVAADERVYVTRFEALNDNAGTATGVSVRAGFGTANVPTASATGVSGMIGTHPGLAPGSGIMAGTGAGVIAVGGAGEEPRLTSTAATAGNLHVLISYFLIDETP